MAPPPVATHATPLPTPPLPASTHSAQEVVRTANGLVLVGGEIPDNSERDTRRCRRLGCQKQGAKRCIRRYCKPCCQREPLADGKPCTIAEHKGTTPPKVPKSSQPTPTTEDGAAVDEEDPLDVNVTFSRNLQREWQEVFAQAHGQKLDDFNYRNTGQSRAKVESHWTSMWYWSQDGHPPEPMEIKVPFWPFFHPKDIPWLAAEVLVRNDLYWRYDDVAERWIKTDLPFRVDSGMTLYIRASHVSLCPALPTSSSPTPQSTPPSTPQKRSSSGWQHAQGSPSKILRMGSSSSVTDLFRRTTSMSPTSADVLDAMNILRMVSHTPSRSSLSQEYVGNVLPAPVFTPAQLHPSSTSTMDTSLTTSLVGSTGSCPNPAQDPLHCAENPFAPTPVAQSIHPISNVCQPSSSTASDQQQSVQHLNVHVDTSFPFEYACDMIPRIAKVYKDKGNLTVQERFDREFPGFKYKHGTFYDARKVWEEVPQHISTQFLNAGRRPEGRWSLMVQWWRENIDSKRPEGERKSKNSKKRRQ